MVKTLIKKLMINSNQAVAETHHKVKGRMLINVRFATKDLVGKGSSGNAFKEDDRKSLHNIEVVSNRG